MNMRPLSINVEVNSMCYSTLLLITSCLSAFFKTDFFLCIFYSAFGGTQFPLMARTACLQAGHFSFTNNIKSKHISA